MTRTLSYALAFVLVLAFSSAAFAQAQGGGRRGNRGGQGGQGGQPGQRGNFDPAQFREQFNNRLKEQMGVTDDEWKVLQPKVEKVTTAQRNSRGGGGFGGGRRGGPNGGGNNADNQPQTAVAQASRDLRTTVDDKNATADQIAAKLTAYRKAREAARAELQSAQKELRELLTAKQEAVLTLNGILD